MEGSIAPPANLPVGTVGDVGATCGVKDDGVVVEDSDLFDALGLDLRTGDLERITDDLDRGSADLENGYQEDASVICARSCSCDSCINISRSISLDFSNGSVIDLADIDSIEQLTETYIASRTQPLATIQGNVALVDHMMSWDPSAGRSGPPSPPTYHRSTPETLPPPHLGQSSESPAASTSGPTLPAESQRTVSFNTPHPVTCYASIDPTPDDLTHRGHIPRDSDISSPRPSIIRPYSPHSSASHLPNPRVSIPHNLSPSSPQSSHIRATKSFSKATRSIQQTRVDANFENTLRALASGRVTASVLNELRCRSNKSSRSSSVGSPSRGRSNSKFSEPPSQRSVSCPIHEKDGTALAESKSQGRSARQQSSCKTIRLDSFNLKAPGRQLVKSKCCVPSEERPGVRRTLRNKLGSSKQPLVQSGLATRRDVRHNSDSGMGSSASSTLSPSPRGANLFISKKRFDKTAIPVSDSTAQTRRRSITSSSNIIKETETEVHDDSHKAHDLKKDALSETFKEVEDPKIHLSKDHAHGNRKITTVSRNHPSKTAVSRNHPSKPAHPSQNVPEPQLQRGSYPCTRQFSRKSSSVDYQVSGVPTPNCSSTSNRSQLERDFHNLLESLGFVCNPNEPGTTECSIKKQQMPPALQSNPSLYSIPKANLLSATKQRQTSDPTSQPTAPAVLLSDDPDDPRRRTDLKAARYYLDHPVIPPKSNYRSELFAKVDANRARSQPAEGKIPAVSVTDTAKPPESSVDSRRASSQSSAVRRKTRPPVLSALKPINLEQIRSIKQAVDNAIADQKIFVVYGAFPSIREALRSRGWIEKRLYPEKKATSAENDSTTLRNRGSRELFQYGGVGVQTLQSADPAVLALIESMSTNPNEVDFEEELTERAIIGRMLRNVDPNFIWTVKCEAMEWKRLKKKQIINRYPRAFFATKIGLSTFLRQMHWFSEEGISLTRFPRCYNICQADDMDAFVDDFRLTACLSLLKLVIDRFGKFHDAGVQDENGKVPKYAMEFAISRCVDYLVQNSHADLDQTAIPSVHCHQWDQFLAWSYELRTEKGRFSKTCSEPSPQVMSDTAQDVIKRMTEVWPQLEMDGYLNIWILKPGAKSRGRGIHLINRLDAITEHVSPQHIRDARYVAQKYIERPLIIFGTKFDIRQWFLVTSVYPMTIWMYRESYLRFCSQSFSLTNMHESVHLCNNAVQAKYKNGKRDPALPDENMWDSYTFQTYLRALGRPELWDTVIYPGMRQGIIGTLLASQEHMDRRADCFELFGADFMLTEDFNPWLIEINSCPCMAPSTSVTARMCAQCLEDVIKVVIDRQNDKNADTGRFELVYKQHIPPPPPYLGMSLSVRGRRVNNSSSNGSTVAGSPGQSPKTGNRRVRRPASDPARRRQRYPRIVVPEGTARFRFTEKPSNNSESTMPADEASSSEPETDPPTTADNESRPPRTPTPTCPPSRLETRRCSHRPSAVAAMVARQKAKQRVQHNVLAAVGHGVIQPSEDNHKKSIELLREWRQRARTSGLLARSSTNKMGPLSSAHSVDIMRRMSSSSSGSGLVAVGVTLNSLMR